MQPMNTMRARIISLALVLALLVPGIVLAQAATPNSADACTADDGVWLQVPIGTTRCVGGKSAGMTPLEAYILVFYTYFVGAVGVIAATMVMLGGYKWLTAAGNRSKVESAKNTIVSAAFGLMLTLTSWLLLNVLNPATVDSRLNISTIQKPQDESQTPPASVAKCGLFRYEVTAASTCCKDPRVLRGDRFRYANIPPDQSCETVCGTDFHPAQNTDECREAFGY